MNIVDFVFEFYGNRLNNLCANGIDWDGLELEFFFQFSEHGIIRRSRDDTDSVLARFGPVFVDVGLVRDDKCSRIDAQFANLAGLIGWCVSASRT